MKVLGFTYKNKKSFAKIEWNSGKTSEVSFGINGVELWKGCPEKIVEQVKNLLTSYEVMNMSDRLCYENKNDYRYKKISNSLFELDLGRKWKPSPKDYPPRSRTGRSSGQYAIRNH